MNKRQFKKYQRKYCCKTYEEARYIDIKSFASVTTIITCDVAPIGLMVGILDSKDGNLKHPLEVRVCKSVYKLNAHVETAGMKGTGVDHDEPEMGDSIELMRFVNKHYPFMNEVGDDVIVAPLSTKKNF